MGDFCSVIQSCLENPALTGSYDITGTERVSYISLMRQLRDAVGAKTWIIHLPIPLFGLLLKLWALISRRRHSPKTSSRPLPQAMSLR